ncbi:hypothetical protein OEZ86_002470 [Tetradesmus obliquus]|nr:hypothetical protein OEZ86_002470 [Tetradesmus obliquus]
MPERDRKTVDRKFLVHHARLALKARRANSWAAAVPWEVFLNDVLPYRNLDEPIDIDWRSLFLKRFGPMVADASSLTEAAQLLNRDIWKIWGLHFVPDKSPEIMSPGQTLAAGYASCTGLSIFLADACRAVGIPARVAGTPSWVQDRRDSPDERFNNHNWVEVYDGSGWSFTGACEYNTAGLNHTWFFPQPAKGQTPGSHWHAIYAASYRQTGLPFPLAWAPEDESVPGVDVTQAYIDAPVTWAPTAMAAAAAAAAQAAAAAAAAAAGGGAGEAAAQGLAVA